MRSRLVVTCLAVFVALMLTVSHTNAQDFCFNAAVIYATGNWPRSVFAADLDGDNDADLAVANSNSDNVSVLRNNGDGTFAAAVTYAVGTNPYSVFAIDLDGDNNADLAVANFVSNTVSVLKNNGDGTFEAAVNYAAGSGPISVFAADLDGDNDADLAVADHLSNNVSVLENNGDGTFAAAAGGYAVGVNPFSIFAADLDGDNDADLAVADLNSGNVSVLKNNGDETFAGAVTYAVGTNPYSVFAADLDGDNDADLAVANATSGNVSVLKNNGDGTFAAAVNYTAGSAPLSVFAADLDGDNDADLAVAEFGNGYASVLKNNGDGTFAAGAERYAAGSNGPYSIFAADLDRDGDQDLAVACVYSINVSVLINCQYEPPVAVCQDVIKNADADCQAAVTPTEVNNGSFDPEDGINIAMELIPPGPFSTGATPVKLIVTDTQGAKDSCDATVTVMDDTPPDVICPGDIDRVNDPGQCGAVVDFAPVVTDDCAGVSVVALPPSGSFFPVGLTPVMAVATDTSGNQDTCYFNVTVYDAEPPERSCLGDTTAYVPMGQTGMAVDFTSTVNDNCPGATTSCNPASGSSFPLGITVVTCVASDQAGNEDTCNFNVTVALLCDCPCQYDPECDSVISDIFDVTQTINRAFRDAPTAIDSNCPFERTDVDASGATDILDVSKAINVAFRGQAVATNYADPCP